MARKEYRSMANKIDLDKQVSRLVKLVGKKEVSNILGQFEGFIEGITSRKIRLKVVSTLCVADVNDIDGG